MLKTRSCRRSSKWRSSSTTGKRRHGASICLKMFSRGGRRIVCSSRRASGTIRRQECQSQRSAIRARTRTWDTTLPLCACTSSRTSTNQIFVTISPRLPVLPRTESSTSCRRARKRSCGGHLATSRGESTARSSGGGGSRWMVFLKTGTSGSGRRVRSDTSTMAEWGSRRPQRGCRASLRTRMNGPPRVVQVKVRARETTVPTVALVVEVVEAAEVPGALEAVATVATVRRARRLPSRILRKKTNLPGPVQAATVRNHPLPSHPTRPTSTVLRMGAARRRHARRARS
mmetsp:Transcript_23694/g.82423  ORF Transcript_23694/g.82423 Transcript_23694/m.82423 type:complete len:287 (+) Transcript_23694:164-1024(+)